MSQKVVEVIPDRFDETKKKQIAQQDISEDDNGLTKLVRRPTMGTQLKQETYATIRVVKGDGTPIWVVDAGSKRKQPEGGNALQRFTDIYSNFLLQSVQDERAEKQQILETFGEPYIFLFGSRPTMKVFRGVLVNTFDFNWEAEWWHNYENFLRGTKCVENDARIYLQYDQTLVSGYLLGASAVKDSQNQQLVQLSFQVFVTSDTTLTALGNPQAIPGMTSLEKEGQVTDDSFRPETYDPQQLNQISRAPDGMRTGDTGSLEEPGLNQSLGSIAKASWDYIGQTSSGLSTSYGVASADSLDANLPSKSPGKLIRLPSGFASIVEFDIDDQAADSSSQAQAGRKITYTTFDKNELEYVGVGDQYLSSLNINGSVRRFRQSITDPSVYTKKMYEKLSLFFEQNGYQVSTLEAQGMSGEMSSTDRGLLPVSSFSAEGILEIEDSTSSPDVLGSRTQSSLSRGSREEMLFTSYT
jgi:hypothetical protein